MADQARPIRLIQENRGDSSIRLNKALRIGKYKVAFEQIGKSWPLPTSLSARPLVSLLAKILRQPKTCQRHRGSCFKLERVFGRHYPFGSRVWLEHNQSGG